MALTPERVRAFREDYRREKIPTRYAGWRHLAITTSVCVVAIVVALSQLGGITALELLTVPAAWVSANLVEYGVHRGPMHHMRPALSKLYKRHNSEHHRFFSVEVMAVDGPRDFHATLFPAWMALFFVALIGLPMAVVAGLVLGTDVGVLFYAAIVFYYLVYEWIHLGAHMPPDSLIGALPGVARARHHHGLHHDPRLMRRANFNFAVPLGDWLFGTLER
ncbi:MAG: sterol desaturase family protein [Myxococcales bacterium]|nr:sterol desaturase family protein [Myxococcales bacterium]MCA9698528.1 sterol desaturase family protein [Myxococcales bacterium]